MDWSEIQTTASEYADMLVAQAQRVPGSSIVLRYIKSSYQNDPVRSAIELVLFLFAVRYLLAPKYSAQKHKGFVEFTDDEVDELVDEWHPEPLVSPPSAFEERDLEQRPTIIGAAGPKARLSNGRTVSNLASLNFYNFATNEDLKEKAVTILRNYGVGPCSPPNFYGTQDVHMKTEQSLAAHLGVENVIIYAQAFSTISSVIPSFSKRGDIIVADQAVSFATRKGIQISRSTVRWFKHNDYDDLNRVLQKITREQRGRPLTRRFIVSEGLFENTGEISNLPKLVELKLKYKFRLILEECCSYGVLGRTGRGLTEHQNVDPTLVDMITGSLSGPLCGGGGFCAGSRDIVEHQRISSLAYTFSAALPAMMATTADEAVRILQEAPAETIIPLREHIKAMRAQLDPRSEWVRCASDEANPIQMIVFKDDVVEARGWGSVEQESLMQDIVDECMEKGVLVTRLKSMPLPLGASAKDLGWQPQPAVKVCVTIGLSRKEIERAGQTIQQAVAKIVKSRKSP